jgi:hypothetical protein
MIEGTSEAGAGAKGYHEALGLFIEEFASTEAFMFMLLCHYAKVDLHVGKVVFSRVTISQTIDLVKSVTSVNNSGEPRKSDLENALKQLESINQTRNKVVHWIPFSAVRDNVISLSGGPGDVRHLTNEMTRKHRSEIEVPPAMLAQMTDDLKKIQTHICYHLSFDSLPESAMRLFDRVRCAPWRYTKPLDTAAKPALGRSRSGS